MYAKNKLLFVVAHSPFLGDINQIKQRYMSMTSIILIVLALVFLFCKKENITRIFEFAEEVGTSVVVKTTQLGLVVLIALVTYGAYWALTSFFPILEPGVLGVIKCAAGVIVACVCIDQYKD